MNIYFLFFFILNLVFADGDYQKHVSALQGLETQIQTLETNIKGLIAEKNKTKDNTKVKEIVVSIKEQLKQRKDLIEKQRKEYHHIRFEHPERGQALEHKYKRIDSQHEKEFEDEINSLLSGIVHKVRQKFPVEE